MAGERDVKVLSDLARGRMRSKRHELEDALNGCFLPYGKKTHSPLMRGVKSVTGER